MTGVSNGIRKWGGGPTHQGNGGFAIDIGGIPDDGSD